MDGSGIPFKKIEQAQLADLQKKMAAEGKDFPTINGFPTVLKTDGTEFDEFKSDRTVAALTTWVKQE